MQNLINHFVGAAVLAGLTACGSAPDKVTIQPFSPKSLTPESLLSESARIDSLGFAREESSEIRTIALLVLNGSRVLSQAAKKGNVTRKVCNVVLDPDSDAEEISDYLKEQFEVSVAREVALGGETEEGQRERVGELAKGMKMLKENNDIIKEACIRKYTI